MNAFPRYCAVRSVLVPALIFLSASASTCAQEGYLFIVGGGKRPPSLMKEFVDLAGGAEQARILVIPIASSVPDSAGMEQAESFRDLGVRHVSWTRFTREQAERGDPLPLLSDVTGVFFSGGDQSRITETMLHTPVHDRLHELYRKGAVIGGTSAGAAAMSRVMITGAERGEVSSRMPSSTVRAGTVVTTEGLGLLTDMIIDQHFLARRRWGRLLSVVLEHPSLIGVGIDESTAIIVGGDPGFRVAGEGTVTVIDARTAEPVHVDERGNLGTSGVLLHLLHHGDTFSPVSGRTVSNGSHE